MFLIGIQNQFYLAIQQQKVAYHDDDDDADTQWACKVSCGRHGTAYIIMRSTRIEIILLYALVLTAVDEMIEIHISRPISSRECIIIDECILYIILFLLLTIIIITTLIGTCDVVRIYIDVLYILHVTVYDLCARVQELQDDVQLGSNISIFYAL